jgi:single-stranded DNA-binding protein
VFGYSHPDERDAVRDAEEAFDRLNLRFGVPADQHSLFGRQAVRDREAEGEKRSVTEIEADEVGASLKFATAKVERASERTTSDRTQGRERQAERGDFNEPPPF